MFVCVGGWGSPATQWFAISMCSHNPAASGMFVQQWAWVAADSGQDRVCVTHIFIILHAGT